MPQMYSNRLFSVCNNIFLFEKLNVNGWVLCIRSFVINLNNLKYFIMLFRTKLQLQLTVLDLTCRSIFTPVLIFMHESIFQIFFQILPCRYFPHIGI